MRTRQHGLSLIELLISLTLGIVLMTGVAQMFLTSQETYTTQRAMSRIQESGRMAVDFLSRDIRMAGYRGCLVNWPGVENFTNRLDVDLSAAENFIYDFGGDDIVGMDADDFDDVDGIDPKADTEALVIRRASGGNIRVDGRDANGNNAVFDTVEVPEDGCYQGSQLCEDDIIMITDCAAGHIFRANNIQSPGGGGGRINVNAGGGNNPPRNLDPGVDETQYESGQLMTFNTTIYFIAQSDFNQGNDVDSLWRKVGEQDAVELVEGVDDIEIHYGASDELTDYKTLSEIDTMGDWSWDDVVAVRVHLLLEGMEDNATPDDQTLDFGGNEVTFTDGRLRQVFTSTIGIRSRLN